MATWYQIEFYSDQERRWVPLFAKFPRAEDALERAKQVDPPRRVMKITQTTELVAEKQEA